MRNRAAVCLVTLVMLLSGAASGGAQSVLNPRIVEFDPSPDHNTVGPNNVPVVQRYELQFYLLGGAQLMMVSDLGKPTPESDGKIRVDFTTKLASWPPNGDYQARVAAVGPTGAGQSDTSNPFSFQTCALSIGATSWQAGASGGTSSVAISTAAGCAWAATTTSPWITLQTLTGSGSGNVAYSVAANSSSAPRTGTLLIGGVSFTVTQASASGVPSCTYALSPSGTVVGSNGSSGKFTLTCTTGCSWTTSKSASWITMSTTSGSGSAAISYSIGKNTSGAVRSGTISAGGVAFSITQGVPTRPTTPKKPRVTIIG